MSPPLSLAEFDSRVAEDPEVALGEARGGFLRAFPERISSAGVLARTAAHARRDSQTAAHISHQMAGLAGIMGFAAVSERALELDQLLGPHGARRTPDAAKVART